MPIAPVPGGVAIAAMVSSMLGKAILSTRLTKTKAPRMGQ